MPRKKYNFLRHSHHNSVALGVQLSLSLSLLQLASLGYYWTQSEIDSPLQNLHLCFLDFLVQWVAPPAPGLIAPPVHLLVPFVLVF
jgi:hypothetical protein